MFKLETGKIASKFILPLQKVYLVRIFLDITSGHGYFTETTGPETNPHIPTKLVSDGQIQSETQNEPHHEKTNILLMRKQSCRSVPLFALHR